MNLFYVHLLATTAFADPPPSGAGAPEVTVCNESCVGISFCEAGIPTWWETAKTLNPEELDEPGGFARIVTVVRRPGEPPTFSTPPGQCRQVVVEPAYGFQIARSSHRLTADGACEALQSDFHRPVQAVERPIGVKKWYEETVASSGLQPRLTTSLSEATDLSAVTRVGEVCAAITTAGLAEGRMLACILVGAQEELVVVEHKPYQAPDPVLKTLVTMEVDALIEQYHREQGTPPADVDSSEAPTMVPAPEGPTSD